MVTSASVPRSSRRWLPALLRASAEIVVVVNRDGELIVGDERLGALLGRSTTAGATSLRVGQVFPGVDLTRASQPGTDFAPAQLQRPDGLRIWVLLKAVALPPPDRGEYLLLRQEPAAIRRIVDQLDYVEEFDPETGFLSRNRGHQQLMQLVASGTPGCCLLITLKPLQADQLTRPQLQTLLQRIVATCQAVPGFDPTVAHSSVDELQLLSLHPEALERTEGAAALKAAIAAAVAAVADGVSVDTGLCRWSAEAPSATAILEAARLDQLAGVSGVHRLQAELESEGLRQELLRAMEQGELVFYIEPQVRAADGVAQAGELLVRWQHPQRGLLMPGQFIDQLEHPACAGAFIRWSIEAAIATARDLRQQLGDWFPLSLNISGSGFHADLPAELRQQAAAAGMPAAVLELEITERLIADSEVGTANALQELREAGFRIAVDDFGTGYSSLAYIRRFPLDRLKIDRSFVMGIAESEEDRLITTAIISLSHVLDLGVVVEGVETLDQAKILRDLGAETFQGYLISRALPLPAFVDLVLASRRGQGLDLSSLGHQGGPRHEPVVWKRSYSTDVVSVDDEHRHLFDVLNRLTRTLSEAPEDLDPALALSHLGEETNRHFLHEELVMANIRYDHLESHRQRHQELLQEFGERRDALLQQFKLGDFDALISYLKVWLLHHLMSEDTRLHRFLNGRTAEDGSPSDSDRGSAD
jgi:hemerythrin-like metal-binding protein